MTRLFDGFVALEMVVLGILEIGLCFLVFYILLLPGDVVQAAIVHNGLGHGLLGLNTETASHAAVLAMTIGVISMAMGMYRPEICLQTRRLLVNSVIAGVLAFPAILVLSMVTDLDPSFILGQDALWPMKILLSWILLLFVTRLCFRAVLRSGLLSRQVLIVGSREQAGATAAAIRTMRRGFFRVAGVVSPDADQTAAAKQAALEQAAVAGPRLWAIVVTADGRAAVERYRGPVRVYDDVAFREQHLRRLDLAHMDAGWLAGVRDTPGAAVLRRVADIAMALLILALAMPVLLLTALAVRMTSPGPVLYRQVRVGLSGRPFVVLKFRSMFVDAEAQGPAWAAAHDPRVTPVGQLIRRMRIDELPQLVNVLRGEMSIIGPRPERPHFVAQLDAAIPFHAARTLVKPGITGWAQVNYPYGASVEDARQKLSYDLYYVKHRGVWLDLQILLATVRVILFQEGAR